MDNGYSGVSEGSAYANGNGRAKEFFSRERAIALEVEKGRERFCKSLSERIKEEAAAEAKRRDLEYKQWEALLHVTAAAHKDPEWIDEIFTFPGDGKIRVKGDLDLSDHPSLNYLP